MPSLLVRAKHCCIEWWYDIWRFFKYANDGREDSGKVEYGKALIGYDRCAVNMMK